MLRELVFAFCLVYAWDLKFEAPESAGFWCFLAVDRSLFPMYRRGMGLSFFLGGPFQTNQPRGTKKKEAPDVQ